jgi:hypothetical protein
LEIVSYKENKQESKPKESDAYSLYLYGMRYPVTRDTYLRRLRTFFNHIQLLSNDASMNIRCNLFVDKSRTSPDWAFSQILNFLQRSFDEYGVVVIGIDSIGPIPRFINDNFLEEKDIQYRGNLRIKTANEKIEGYKNEFPLILLDPFID